MPKKDPNTTTDSSGQPMVCTGIVQHLCDLTSSQRAPDENPTVLARIKAALKRVLRKMVQKAQVRRPGETVTYVIKGFMYFQLTTSTKPSGTVVDGSQQPHECAQPLNPTASERNEGPSTLLQEVLWT